MSLAHSGQEAVIPGETEAAIAAYHAEVVACCKRRDAESNKVRFGGRMVARFLGMKARDDGTLRCIACGQIDAEPWHRPDLCFGLIGLLTATTANSVGTEAEGRSDPIPSGPDGDRR